MADQRRGRPEKKTPRHKKKPSNQRAANNKRAKRRRKGSGSGSSSPPRRRVAATRAMDPSAGPDSETRFLQPYQATKTYLCPGCNQDIPPGLGHIVAVPPDEPDLRRHWHRGCWNNRHNL